MQEFIIDVKNGIAFFADEVAIMHNPAKVVLDFKNTSPRMEGQQLRFIVSHTPVVLDPYVAKDFLKALTDNIQKYEKTFGEIKRPTAVEKARKMHKHTATTSTKQDYFG